MRRPDVAPLLVLVVALATAEARADIATPSDWVERCTLENATGPGEECLEGGWREWGIDRYLVEQGFCLRCAQRRGRAIYCRPEGATPALPAGWRQQRREQFVAVHASRCITPQSQGYHWRPIADRVVGGILAAAVFGLTLLFVVIRSRKGVV